MSCYGAVKAVMPVRKISIDNFGPIDGHFEMDLDKKLTILIGEQATGKSTIAKLYALCNQCIVSKKSSSENSNEYLEKLYKGLLASLNFTNKPHIHVKYKDSFGNLIEIHPPEKKQVFLRASHAISNYHECIYIPSGRSVFPLLFENYAAASRIKIDPLTDEFLIFLSDIRKGFSFEIPSTEEMLNPDTNVEILRACLKIIHQILKGEYIYETGNDRIQINKDVSVPITAASSGQQEILYILMTLFHILLNPKPYTIIIEEPEAHIFPVAQKLVMELIARVINATGSHVIITTHSPYILTSTNLLMHSAKVENSINDEKTVIDKMARLNPDDVGAFLLSRNERFSYKSIIDIETGLIDAEEIDTVSQIIDKGMSDLVALEVKHGL